MVSKLLKQFFPRLTSLPLYLKCPSNGGSSSSAIFSEYANSVKVPCFFFFSPQLYACPIACFEHTGFSYFGQICWKSCLYLTEGSWLKLTSPSGHAWASMAARTLLTFKQVQPDWAYTFWMDSLAFSFRIIQLC